MFRFVIKHECKLCNVNVFIIIQYKTSNINQGAVMEEEVGRENTDWDPKWVKKIQHTDNGEC